MATETELTEALKTPDSEGGASVQVRKSPPESTSKFILKLILICAVILALGVGVCLALVFTMSDDDSQTWPQTCQNDTSLRRFSAQNTQFYFSEKQEPWSLAEIQCQEILGPKAGLVTLDEQDVQNFVIQSVIGIGKVGDFWSSGRLTQRGEELDWVWATGNTSLTDQDWANDQTAPMKGKHVCLNVEIGTDDDGSEWVTQECNFPSHYVCQAECDLQ